MDKVEFATGAVTTVFTKPLNMAAGAGVITWFSVALPDPTRYMLQGTISSAGEAADHPAAAETSPVSANTMLLAPPFALKLPVASVVTVSVDDVDGTVTLRSDATALYVTLTTRSAGRFGENAFMLLPNTPKKVPFLPWGQFDLSVFRQTLRVEHLQEHCFP